MKTCVFLTGRIKTWQKNLQDFKNHLSNYDYDVYASLNCDLNDDDANLIFKESFMKDVICQPTNYPNWLDEMKINCFEHQKFNFFSQCFHRYLVFQELKKIKIYERYIFTRIDLITKDVLPLINCQTNEIFFPKSHRHGLDHNLVNDHKLFYDKDVPLINDQILICNYDSASSVSNLFLEIKNMYFNENIWWHPETMLHSYLKKKNIELNMFDFDYELDPERNKPS